MRGAHLDREGKDGFVLTAYSIKVGGHMILASGLGQGTFTAAGAIDLTGADIGGYLNMDEDGEVRPRRDSRVWMMDSVMNDDESPMVFKRLGVSDSWET